MDEDGDLGESLGVRLCGRGILKGFAGFVPPLACAGVPDGATVADEGLRMRPVVDMKERQVETAQNENESESDEHDGDHDEDRAEHESQFTLNCLSTRVRPRAHLT